MSVWFAGHSLTRACQSAKRPRQAKVDSKGRNKSSRKLPATEIVLWAIARSRKTRNLGVLAAGKEARDQYQGHGPHSRGRQAIQTSASQYPQRGKTPAPENRTHHPD